MFMHVVYVVVHRSRYVILPICGLVALTTTEKSSTNWCTGWQLNISSKTTPFGTSAVAREWICAGSCWRSTNLCNLENEFPGVFLWWQICLYYADRLYYSKWASIKGALLHRHLCLQSKNIPHGLRTRWPMYMCVFCIQMQAKGENVCFYLAFRKIKCYTNTTCVENYPKESQTITSGYSLFWIFGISWKN